MINTDLQKQIDEAVNAGKHTLHITGTYTIEETIFLPSRFTLILEDCTLTMADGVMTQMFRNAGYIDGGENTAETADHDIRIIGIGEAVLDGGNYNGLSERNSGKNGNPHISKNNLLLFSNVDGFEIRGLQIKNQRWWALNFLYCRNGVLHDLDFCADDTWVNDSGERIHGLRRDNYEGVYIKNADGIDLRSGCHNFLIENITGFCEDDIVALTDLAGNLEAMYAVSGVSCDISDVIIRNVRGCSYCSIIRLLNQRPHAYMRHILIDGVFDTSGDSVHMDRGIYAVRVGDTHLYGPEQPKDDAMSDIRIQNIYARTTSAVNLAGGMTNVSTDNIVGYDGCQFLIEDKRTVSNT